MSIRLMEEKWTLLAGNKLCYYQEVPETIKHIILIPSIETPTTNTVTYDELIQWPELWGICG